TLNSTSGGKTSQGKLILHITSNQAGNIPLEVSYLTHSATWQPSYEMRIDKINEPIQMLYKAQVQQNTGIDWKNVKLSLTSGAANQNTFAPELQPWFLDYYYPSAYQDEKVMEEVSIASKDKVRKKEIEGRPNASMIQN